MEISNETIKNRWFKYLSEEKNEKLKPILADYFNDKVDFEYLNDMIIDNGLVPFHIFKKEIFLDEVIFN